MPPAATLPLKFTEAPFAMVILPVTVTGPSKTMSVALVMVKSPVIVTAPRKRTVVPFCTVSEPLKVTAPPMSIAPLALSVRLFSALFWPIPFATVIDADAFNVRLSNPPAPFPSI